MHSSRRCLDPGCVLVVDDLPENRLLVRLLLEDDYRVAEASTGAQALARARHVPPALVLLDLSLGGEDGHAVLAQLRDALPPETPILAFSASMNRVRSTRLGFDGCVSKPIVDIGAFYSAIEATLTSPMTATPRTEEAACRS